MIKIERIASLPGHKDPVYALAGSRKEHIFFTGGGEAAVVEWSLKTMQHIKVLVKVRSTIYSLHSPIGKDILLIGERSGLINIFDFPTQQILTLPQKHLMPVFDIQSSVSDGLFYAASEDGSLSVWSLEDYSHETTLQVNESGLRAMSLHPRNGHIALAGKDNRISIIDRKGMNVLQHREGHTLPVFSITYSPDGNYLFSGSRDAQIKVWDTLNGYHLVKTIPAHLFAVNHIAFHPSGHYFASASMDKSIKIWRADDFSLAKIISFEKMNAHSLSVNKLLWMEDGKKLVSVGNDKNVLIWSVEIDE